MGAEQSKSSDERVFSSDRQTPIAFSQDLINHLEDNLSSPGLPSERQITLDNHVRARIQAELERLQSEEEHVRQQIEAALERENLDREKSLTEKKSGEVVEGEEERNLASSTALQSDLEEVQKKVERFQTRRQLDDHPEVKDAREAVVQCYQSNAATPLNCIDSVERFKQSVAQVERQFVDSLR